MFYILVGVDVTVGNEQFCLFFKLVQILENYFGEGVCRSVRVVVDVFYDVFDVVMTFGEVYCAYVEFV